MEKNLTNKDIYEGFGKFCKEFLQKKYGTLKKAAESLDLNQSLVSHYIKGSRVPNRKFEDAMRRLGFDMTYFDIFSVYEDTKNIQFEGLTFDQVKFVVLQLKNIIGEKNETIRALREVNRQQENHIQHLNNRLHGRY